MMLRGQFYATLVPASVHCFWGCTAAVSHSVCFSL